MSSQREVLIRILALSVDRRRKESLYVVLLWLGITHTHARLDQIRKCPPLPGFDLPGLCYRFHGETETTHRPCAVTHIT